MSAEKINQTATLTTIEVDGRRLTKGVVQQLDECPLEHLDVWGRVRIEKALYLAGPEVVGVDRRSGNLCRGYLITEAPALDHMSEERAAPHRALAVADLPLIVLGGAR